MVMKHSIYGHVIIPVIIAVLAFLPSTTSATEAEYNETDPGVFTTHPSTTPWFDQNNIHGSFIYHYPLSIPPGRQGLQPSLELTYNSYNTSVNGFVGYGWNLAIPSIERLNKTGLEDLYGATDLTSSLWGELEAVSLTDTTHGTYGAKVESQCLSRVRVPPVRLPHRSGQACRARR